jgi:hypothetical protein
LSHVGHHAFHDCEHLSPTTRAVLRKRFGDDVF